MSSSIFNQAHLHVNDTTVAIFRKRPKLLKHFALYFLSSFALSEINRPEVSPMRTHMPFRRACQRMLMRSLIKEWRIEKKVKKDPSLVSEPRFAISPLTICTEMLQAAARLVFFEEFLQPFVDVPELLMKTSNGNRDQVETAMKKANLRPDAYWSLEHEVICFISKTIDKRAASTAPQHWQAVSSVIGCSTILLDNCRETVVQFWEQENRAGLQNTALRERLAAFVGKYWCIGKQARAAGRLASAYQAFQLGRAHAEGGSRHQRDLLHEEAECAVALARTIDDSDFDDDDALVADFKRPNPDVPATGAARRERGQGISFLEMLTMRPPVSESTAGPARRQILRNEAIASFQELLAHLRVSESAARNARHHLARLYKKNKMTRPLAIREEERRLRLLSPAFPRARAESRFFVAKCYRAMGDMKRFRNESLKGIEEFDAKPEYKQGKYALQYAKSIEALAWNLDYLNYAQSAPYLTKALDVLDEECRRSRTEDGIIIPNSDLNYDALYTKQAIAALICLKNGVFLAEKTEAAEYRQRHPELDLRSLVLLYATDKLLLAKSHLRTDNSWIVGFHSQAMALLDEFKEDKFTTLDTVLRFLRQSVTQDRKPLLPQSMRYTVQTAEDLEFKVLYPPQHGDDCSHFPLDDIVARIKEAGDLANAEPLTSVIRLCYKLHPERGKIKISAASHKMLMDFANFKEGCGTPIYRQMMRDALACTDPR